MIMKINAQNATTTTLWSLENADTTVCWDAKSNNPTIPVANASSLSSLKTTTVSFPTASLSTTMDVTLVSVDSSLPTQEPVRKCPTDALRPTEVSVLNVFPTTSWKEEFALSKDVFHSPMNSAQPAKATTNLLTVHVDSRTVSTGKTILVSSATKDLTWSVADVSRVKESSYAKADNDIVP